MNRVSNIENKLENFLLRIPNNKSEGKFSIAALFAKCLTFIVRVGEKRNFKRAFPEWIFEVAEYLKIELKVEARFK